MKKLEELDIEVEQVVNSPLSYQKLQWLIKSGLEVIDKKFDQSVLVVGNTGSGKSTLINALTGKKLESIFIEDSGEFQIRLAKGQHGAVIGDTSVSETTVPKSWFDNNTGVTYWDCPGFEDTKGSEQDIANGMFIEKVFQNSKEVKIILVMSEAQLNSDRSLDILNMAKKFSSLFKDMDEIKDSVCLIGTKIENPKKNNPIILQKKFQKIVEEHKKSTESNVITEGVQKFFNIISTPGKVAIFTSPDSEGEVIIDKTILEALDRSIYTKLSGVNIPISFESKVAINSFADHAKLEATKSSEQLRIEINKYLKYYQDQLATIALPNLIKVQKLVDETYKTKKEVDKGNFEIYFNKMEELCNLVGFKKTINKEDLFSWLKPYDREQAIYKLHPKELEKILNQNHFKSIIESVKFFKKIQGSNDSLSEFALRDFDGIQKLVDGVVSDKKHTVAQDIEITIKKIFSKIDLHIDNIRSNENELITLSSQIDQLSSLVNPDYDSFFKNLKNISFVSDTKSEVDSVYSNVLSFQNSNITLNVNYNLLTNIACLSKAKAIAYCDDIIKKRSEIEIAKKMAQHAETEYNIKKYSSAYNEIKEAILKLQIHSIKENDHYVIKAKCEYQLGYSENTINSSFDQAGYNSISKANIYNSIGKEYCGNREYIKAINAYDKAYALYSNSLYTENKAEAYGCYADQKYLDKEYQIASEHYNNAYKFTSKSEKKSLYKDKEGDSLYKLTKYTEAISCYETAYGQKSDQSYKEKIAVSYMQIADKYNSSKQYKKAAEHYQKAYDNDNKQMYKESAANSWGILGDESFNSGANKLAQSYYLQAYYGTSNSALEAMYKDKEGDSWYKLQQYQEAKSCYESAYSKKAYQSYKEKLAKTWDSIGDEHYETNRYDESLECYSKAYEFSNNSGYKNKKAKVYGCLGDQYYNKANYNMALDYYKKAYENANNKHDSANYKCDQGWAYYKMSEYTKAEDCANGARDFGEGTRNNIANLYDCIASGYHNSKKYSQADKVLEEAVSISSSPDNKASMYNEFGCKYYNNKLYDKAKDYFYQAYLKTSDPIKEAIYKNNQGDALYCLTQYNDALSCYKVALDKQPNNDTYKENTAKTYNALGNQYHNNKSYHTAIEYYDKANEIKPDSLYKENKASSYNGLGCQYYNKHTKDGYTDAKYYFQKAYDISSDSSKYGTYRQNRDDAQGQLDKCVIFMVKVEYDNPILNYPEMLKTLTNNLFMNYFEVIDKVSTFDRDFVREVCLSGNVELLQECFEL